MFRKVVFSDNEIKQRDSQTCFFLGQSKVYITNNLPNCVSSKFAPDVEVGAGCVGEGSWYGGGERGNCSTCSCWLNRMGIDPMRISIGTLSWVAGPAGRTTS